MEKFDKYPRSPDFYDKPVVKEAFEKDEQMRARTEGVIEYLLANYDLDAGFYGYINHKKRIQYVFNRSREGIFRCVINKSSVRVSFNVNKIKVKGRFKIKEKHGKKDKITGSITINKFVDFKICTEDDLENFDLFLSQNKISNIVHRENYWKNISFKPKEKELSVTAYTKTGRKVIVHGYEALLVEKFEKWLHKNKKAKKVLFEVSTQTETSYDRLDAVFEIEKAKVLAELKSIRGGKTNSKLCIRNALGQILDYRHYGSGNSADQLWIVIDAEPSQQDIKFIKTISSTYKIPLKLVYQTKDYKFKEINYRFR